ncbi:lipoxygenase 2.2, chloroplastic [Aegilops tauschii subsp. strangulata]|uniref:lipoxygenase 2.2, chloroplastic n=1 Tax=Aegilops tauschii subsp. strangulata TaxID=200361 RepID=UPI00098BB949|nr:LOW QUALITY PROTEIN: lipoxygenase 2.2, chloroplastic [Aegilops tauschii subsp. strangulata]
MAAMPLALGAPSHHGSSSFSSTVSSVRRAVPVPEARRTSSNARHRISTVGCTATATATTTTLSEVDTVGHRAAPRGFNLTSSNIKMKATVTVHMKSFWSGLLEITSLSDKADWLYHWTKDLLVREWLQLELVSELNPEHPISSYAKYSGTGADEEFYTYEATFTVPASFCPIGAVRVVNEHYSEMFLGEVRIFPADQSPLSASATLFHCNSWIHPSHISPDKPRTFFPVTYSYLPSKTPGGMKKLRHSELLDIRGNGTDERKPHDRIYDYDVYNDLGNKRPVLGGEKRPYPRRCRTGRPHYTQGQDTDWETRATDKIYVPRDEAFTEIKEAAFLRELVLSVGHSLCTLKFKDMEDHKSQSFPSLAAIDALYEVDFRNQPSQSQPHTHAEIAGVMIGFVVDELERLLHGAHLPEEICRFLKFETPEIHDKDKFAWFRDEEFARETLAGMNPLSIQLVTELPIVSEVDGPSLITKELIEEQINGVMTAEEAMRRKKLFMLDYHDMFLPFVHKVRMLEDTTLYGSRTLFFLTGDGTLRPIAIELTRPESQDHGRRSSPSPTKDEWRQVFTPGSSVTESWLWQLAKSHVLAHDTGYHQLVSHWLRTHCCVEPYIIAANRQLSRMHPIYQLLHPHFRYTMEINAQARQMLIDAGGIIESAFSPGRYCMELSSVAYDKFWRFDMEALPEDLIRRGMAVRGEDGKLELAIEDYPYANDGLMVWDAIKQWASDYVKYYYPGAKDIIDDHELQGWWTEVRTKGHEDKKDEPWWPVLDSHESLVQVLATIMWVTSAHHAAVNFGQYPLAGYIPNRPTITRKNMPPEMGGPDSKEMRAFLEEPERVLLDTFPSQYQSVIVMLILNLLSSHSSDEEYMGTYQELVWRKQEKIKEAFDRFKSKMVDIAAQIDKANMDPKLKNRNGPGVVPYVLLRPSNEHPEDEKTVMGMGIPYSISI